MVYGHNTNVKIGSATYHVQTEDRGPSHALIDTTVYYRGRVLHRRTNNYLDLLPLNEDSEQALKLRLDEQHHTVLEEMQSGALQVAIPQPTAAMSESTQPGVPPPNAPAEGSHPVAVDNPASLAQRRLAIELRNAKSWLSGKRATLQLFIEESGTPVGGAKIAARIDGSAGQETFNAVSGSDGLAQLEFAMPKITSAEAALVISAEDHGAHGQLRFALRAKPSVSSV